MHELSLANDIIETVKQTLSPDELPSLQSIVLEVGAYSGVVSDSLRFSFEAITAGTELAGAELEIIDIPFRLRCRQCKTESNPEFPVMLCENCGSTDTEVLSGEELKIKELKISDNKG